MTDITTSDLRDEMAAVLPDGYILSKDVVFPDKEVPITAVVNGKKVTVGSGRVDPDTGVFAGTIDNSPNGEILRGQLEEKTFSFNQFLNVSELQLSQVREVVNARIHSISIDKEPGPYGGTIEKIEVFPNGHAIIKQQLDREEPDGPTPRFHDHD